jgi:macrocin-O-methyltransferase TylF-like protien
MVLAFLGGMMEVRHTDRALAKVTGEITQQSGDEHGKTQRLFEIQQTVLPQMGNHWNIHQTVFLKRQSLSRLIYYYELYQKVVDIPGVICEFGIQWGATLAALVNLRGMLEPFNHSRLIYGFDTFEGFVQLDAIGADLSSPGDYSTTEGYCRTLEEILQLQESGSPLSHIKKFELVPGDASQTIVPWLERNPHAIVAMAIFDMDVYKPTRDVLEAILPRLTRGSLLVFDELNCAHFPGETTAVQEVIGLNKLKLRRFPHQPFCTWAVFGE